MKLPIMAQPVTPQPQKTASARLHESREVKRVSEDRSRDGSGGRAHDDRQRRRDQPHARQDYANPAAGLASSLVAIDLAKWDEPPAPVEDVVEAPGRSDVDELISNAVSPNRR